MPSRLSQRLGKITSLERIPHGIHAKTPEGALKVQFYSDTIARVSLSHTGQFENYPYAVQAEPSGVEFQMQDQAEFIELKTSRLTVVVHKDPVSFSFLDAKGRVLNEEVASLGTSWIGDEVTSYRTMQENERFIGLGEKTGPLDRRGAGYQNWNTDAFSYSLIEDPLYCSTPFYMGLHHGLQYGIFADNTHKSFFNFGASNNRFSSFSSDTGGMNYYFIAGDSVAEIIYNYSFLTGFMPLPPKWSIGYQQCRYSYYPDFEVRSLADTFRAKNIPADAIVLDIHYMDKYKIFTWDQGRFPDPKGLIDELKSKNFEVVLMCDPGIKVEEGYEPYDDGLKQDVFLKYPDGENYTGQVWPGWCHFPDYTNPRTRKWWKEKLKSYSSLGVEGFWNDMNEIASWGHMLPENVEFDHDGERATSRKARNVYGFQMARSTYEAACELLGGKRPFNLTRSAYSGVQRYSAVWTGDNESYDEHMMLGVRMVNSMGMTGIPFVGYDVGGFTGEAGVKLFARWVTIGAFSPFFRGHTMVNTPDAEPWAFGEEVENISRNFIRLRYQLMPYLYSLFAEAARSGLPVQRSMAITHTHDARVYEPLFQHQYFFGPFLLIVPVVSHQEYTKVFFPEGQWYYLYDGKKIAGNQEVIVESPIHKLPVYVQAGAILPMQRPVMHTREKVTELILHIYSGMIETTFDYYEDDGSSFRHEQGEFCRRLLHYQGSEKKLTIGKQEGSYTCSWETIRLILHGETAPSGFKVNGKKEAARSVHHAFFLPLEKYDPITDPDSMGDEAVVEVTFPYSQETIEIRW